MSGTLEAPQQADLVSLLQTELSHSQVTLTLDTSDAHPFAWVGTVERDSRVLLIAWLDTRDTDRWRLYLVDAARNRAIMRPLPGGLRGDAAALEAISSIIVSAVSSLQDGLEVASKPLAEVVTPEPRSPSKATPPPAAHPESQRPRPAPLDHPVVLHGTLAVAVASFDHSAPVTAGLSAAVGSTLYSRVGLRLSLARHFPATLETTFGRFRVDRTLARLSAGWVLPMGPMEVEPEAAWVAEHLSRSDTEPAAGVVAREDTALWHLGAGLGLRTRYRASRGLSLEWTNTGAYFPNRVRYKAAAPNQEPLAAPWAVVVETSLGLAISAP